MNPRAARRFGPGWWASRAAFAIAAAVVFMPVALFHINVFDEGFINTGALVTSRGGLPFRDFLTTYGPGQFAFIALLFRIFGEDLLVTRIAHALLLGLLAVAVHATAREISASRHGAFWATAAFVAVVAIVLPSVAYPAISALLLLLVAAWLFSDWATSRRWQQLMLASIAAGGAGLFRWDFGPYGLVALALATAAVIVLPRGARARAQALLPASAAVLLPGTIVMLAVYLPLLALGGLVRWYDEILRFMLFEFHHWRKVDYLRPAIEALLGALRTGSATQAVVPLLLLSYVAVPVAAVLVTGACALRALRRSEGEVERAAALALVLCLLCLLLFNQMRVRPHPWQGFPAFVVSLPLAAAAVRCLGQWRHGSRPMRAAGLLAGGFLLVLCGWLAAPAYVQALTGMRVDGLLPRATWIRVPDSPAARAHWNHYAALLRHLEATTAPDERIFSGVRDSTRLFVNDAMLYFLADRLPAVRHAEMEPGIANSLRGQTELIESLRQGDVRTIVLWDLKNDGEPNRTATSNGIDLLDRFIRENFDEVERFGQYSVWRRKGSGEAPTDGSPRSG